MSDSIKHGVTAQGRKELKKYLEGKKITYKQGALGKCYECNLGYSDGKCDCEIQSCPLYGFMPYRK